MNRSLTTSMLSAAVAVLITTAPVKAQVSTEMAGVVGTYFYGTMCKKKVSKRLMSIIESYIQAKPLEAAKAYNEIAQVTNNEDPKWVSVYCSLLENNPDYTKSLADMERLANENQ